MNDVLNTEEFFEENYIKKVNDFEWNTYCVPYEYIKYKSYKIKEISEAPKLKINE